MSVSLDEQFCSCNRRITRAFNRAIQEGDYCPRCMQKLNPHPTTNSIHSSHHSQQDNILDIHLKAATQQISDSFDSASNTTSLHSNNINRSPSLSSEEPEKGNSLPEYENTKPLRPLSITSGETDINRDDPIYQYINPAHLVNRQTTTAVSSDTDSHQTVPIYDSVDSDSKWPTPPTDMGDDPIAEALQVLARSMTHTGKFRQPSFKGSEGENIEAFISKFDQFCAINGKNDRYKTQVFPTLLDGRAYTLYQDLSPDLQQDYPALINQMKQYFAETPLPPLHAYETLYTQKMADSETVQKFFENLIHKSKHLNITPEQKTALFISGLTKKIKAYVINEKPATLAEALIKAKEAEILRVENDDDTKLLKRILAKIEQPSPPNVSVVDNVNPKSQISCQWCSQTGHAMNQCFSYKRHLEEQKTNHSQKSDPTSCHWCQGTDHAMNKCEEYKVHCQQTTQQTPFKTPQSNQTPSSNTTSTSHCPWCQKLGHPMKECRTFRREQGVKNISSSDAFPTQANNQLPPTCNFCLKPGHRIQECYSYDPNNRPRPGNQNSTRTIVKCYHCGIPGHVIKDCRSYQRENANGTSGRYQTAITYNPHPYTTDPRNQNYFRNQTQNTQYTNHRPQRRPNISVADVSQISSTTQAQPIATTDSDATTVISTQANLRTIATERIIPTPQETDHEDGNPNPTSSRLDPQPVKDTTTACSALIHSDVTPPSMEITALINNHLVACLIDTGSAIDAINVSTFRSLSNTPTLHPPYYEAVTTLDGSNSHVYGQFDTSLELQNVNFTTNLHVINCGKFQAILGRPFLANNKALINSTNNTITLTVPNTSEQITISLQPQTTIPDTQEDTYAMVIDTVSISPFTEAIVQTYPSMPISFPQVILEGSPTICNTHNVAIAASICDGTTKSLYCRVMNPTPEPITLSPNLIIAIIEPLTAEPVILALDPSTDAGKPPSASDPQFNIDDSTLTPQQHQELLHTLAEYSDVFAYTDAQLGCSSQIAHTIDVGNARPIKSAPYRLNPQNREKLKEHIQEMLDLDIIEESNSPWASPIVLVKKSDGTDRFCCDYRKLNALTIKDSYPLPRIDETLDMLSGSHYFSTLDLRSGFWQIPVDEQSRPLTAFTSYQGLYQFKRLPFGLCNSPATFQRVMELVLRGLQWDTCLIYIDDVVIHSPSFETHIQRLRDVLDRLRNANLKLKPEKCLFMHKTVKFLGHIISANGIAPTFEKTELVKSFPAPTNPKQIKQFLGLAGYYRRFIESFSKIATPLNRLLQKDVPFVWSDECSAAFDALKEKLVTAPILAFPNFALPFQLYTDASGEAVGMVLGQIQNGQERVIAYGGRSLTQAERNYTVTELEALAVITGVKHFPHTSTVANSRSTPTTLVLSGFLPQKI